MSRLLIFTQKKKHVSVSDGFLQTINIKDLSIKFSKFICEKKIKRQTINWTFQFYKSKRINLYISFGSILFFFCSVFFPSSYHLPWRLTWILTVYFYWFYVQAVNSCAAFSYLILIIFVVKSLSRNHLWSLYHWTCLVRRMNAMQCKCSRSYGYFDENACYRSTSMQICSRSYLDARYAYYKLIYMR